MRSRLAAVLLRRWLVGPAALFALALVPAVLGDDYQLQVLCLAGILAVAAIGYNIVLGETGMLSLAHGPIFGSAAYAYAISAEHVPTAAAAAVGVGFSLLIALGISALTLARRLNHAYFAIATFALGEVLRNVATQWRSLTGGAGGISIPALELGPWTFHGATTLYPLVAIGLVVGVVVHLVISRSHLGRFMRTVRDDELAAAAMGVPVRSTQMAAFLIGGAYAGVAGVLYGLALTYLTPQILSVELSVRMLAMVVVGGLGSVYGAVAGAIGLSLAPELLRWLDRYWTFVYGSLIVVTVLFARGGLVGLVESARDRLRDVRGPRDPDTAPDRVPTVGAATAPDATGVTAPSAATGSAEVDPEPLRALGPTSAELVVDDVVMEFRGLRAIDHVSIHVTPATIHAVIGPNGAGKTTMLNVIAGQLTPQHGRVTLGDTDLTALPPHRRARAGVGRTFQRSRLFPTQTTRENIRAVAEAGGLRGAAAAETTGLVLTSLGIGALADVEASKLSHGHRRLVEVGRALALRPSVILLDEPAAGLSGADCDRLARLLRWLASENGITVILVEHNMEFVTNLADRITVMNHGSVLAEGDPATVLSDPDVITAYLGEETFVAPG